MSEQKQLSVVFTKRSPTYASEQSLAGADESARHGSGQESERSEVPCHSLTATESKLHAGSFHRKAVPLSPRERLLTVKIMPQGMHVIRSLPAVCNHHEVMHGINPKDKYTLPRDAIRLRRLHSHLR